MTTAKRVALYVRVSTSDQTRENQKRELCAWARAAGHKVVCVFEDFANSREPAPASSNRAGPTPSGRPTARSASTHSGTTCGIGGSVTPAFASTICC